MSETKDPMERPESEGAVHPHHRKKRRSKHHHHRPWYKSTSLKGALNLTGKILLIVATVAVLAFAAWLVIASDPLDLGTTHHSR